MMRMVLLLGLLALPASAQTRSPDPSTELDRATDWLRTRNNEDALSTERGLVLDSLGDTRALERHGDKVDADRRLSEAEQRAREAARAEALRTRRAR